MEKRKIITDDMERCILCGAPAEWHHTIHGTANRRLSDEDGLIVPLCPKHHREGRVAAHTACEVDMLLKIIGQQAFMMHLLECGKAETKDDAKMQFIKRYGKAFI